MALEAREKDPLSSGQSAYEAAINLTLVRSVHGTLMFRMCLHSEWQHIHEVLGSNSIKFNGLRGFP